MSEFKTALFLDSDNNLQQRVFTEGKSVQFRDSDVEIKHNEEGDIESVITKEYVVVTVELPGGNRIGVCNRILDALNATS